MSTTVLFSDLSFTIICVKSGMNAIGTPGSVMGNINYPFLGSHIEIQKKWPFSLCLSLFSGFIVISGRRWRKGR